MTQLISNSTSNYHLYTLLIVLLVFINNYQVSANNFISSSGYQYPSSLYDDLSYEDADDNESPIVMNTFDNEELPSPNPWSQLFHRYSDRSTYTPTYYPSSRSGLGLKRGEVRYIPYLAQKRAIPIEFQKALFAHGIVGRRR